jgi:predicted HicB family RNase H-like nuclease
VSNLNIRNVPEDVHRDAKIAALRGGKTLQEWVIQAIKEKLEREKKK